MRRLLAAVAGASIILTVAGCGDGEKGSPSSPTATRQTARGCPFIDPTDVESVSGSGSVTRRDLAGYEGVVCSTTFVGGGGELVASVIELEGGLAALRKLRSGKVGELGPRSVRPQPALGGDAFLGRERYLAFRVRDRVVVVETGYDLQGKLILSVPQLLRLAHLIIGRL